MDRPAASPGAALRLTSISKRYELGKRSVTALDDVTLTVARGSFVAVMGASGSGKSTLLHCAAGLDRPTSGSVVVGDGPDLASLSESALTAFRRRAIGMVFQSYNLLPALTVGENVTLPLRLDGRRPDRRNLADTLARVGLQDRVDHLPAQLSGGQQQRVAIARALITRPDVIVADEPTGALDTVTGRQVLQLLRGAVDEAGRTTVMVTHDPLAAAWADAVVFLSDGRVVDTVHRPPAGEIAARMARLVEPV